MRFPMRTFLAAALAATLPATLVAQRDDDDDRGGRQQDTSFHWEGTIPEGKWLVLRNLNGAVRVEAGSGDKVQVDAVKRWRRGNPDDVRITVERFGQNKESAVVCAMWNENTECDESGYRSHNDGSWNNRRNDVSVDFTIRLPKGVKVETSTVNGSVRIAGATSVVEASTVNGGVDAASSGGPVTASTVNGDVTARMSDSGTGDLDYSTVNGSVTLELPGPLNAEVDMATVNGSVRSDFPMTLEGRVNPRHIRATIGTGGRRIKVRTVNGSVEIRKA